jgi:hypothetical protein
MTTDTLQGLIFITAAVALICLCLWIISLYTEDATNE